MDVRSMAPPDVKRDRVNSHLLDFYVCCTLCKLVEEKEITKCNKNQQVKSCAIYAIASKIYIFFLTL